MANIEPFNESEKAQLLKEIIAASTLSSQTLAAIVHDLQIPPSWEDIRVPPGRTVRQCQNVFHEVMSSPPQYRPPLIGDPRTNPALMHPPRAPLPPEASVTGSRAIQPRPPHMTRFASESPSSPYSPTSSESQARRRGRPNRAEAERRKRVKEEAAARGDKDPYPSRPRKKPRTQQPAIAETVGATAPPSGTPAAAYATSTPSISNPGASSFHAPSGPYQQSTTSPGLTLAPILSAPAPGAGGGYTRTRSERSALTSIVPPGSFAAPAAPARPPGTAQYELPPASMPPEQPPDRATQRSPHHEPRPTPTAPGGQSTESDSSQQRLSSQAPGGQMEH